MFGSKILGPNLLKFKFPLGKGSRSIAAQLRFSSLATNPTRYSKSSNIGMTRSSLAEGAPSATTNGFLSNETNGNFVSNHTHISETEFLIAGAGPAGASLACFLTSYGIFHNLAIISNDTN
jgi:hypothetical protein